MDATVALATERHYVFWRRSRGAKLVRVTSIQDVELLVDGEWVPIRKPLRLERWAQLRDDDLREHARAFLVANLSGPRVNGVSRRKRLRLSAVGRWFFPPLSGGANRNPRNETADQVREHQTRTLTPTVDDDLAELKEEALRGHETLAERCAVLEQRANFFLGAAALTSSLVLANSGLLLGTGKLGEPWLLIVAIFLALSSVCAVVAGLRAMQAAMTTFMRATPSSVSAILRRAELAGPNLTRAYIGALLVAQNREEVVGNWKLDRLKAARRWFLATVVGVACLALTVLADVVWR
ncbi:MAG TPA: hypothetical protein VHZ54_06495 [Solirubrobacterales bacterium]|jgi:hypothetical protein|nr:hypothetical protein [Solirubrobacterales bacterium]